MTFNVPTYSPKDVKLQISGYSISGWDSLTIARTAQGFTPIKGIRGKHTRSPTGDTSATITLSLLQSSQSNDVLSEIHRLDLENGTGRITLTLKDHSGNSVFNSSEAYITGYPETTYSAEFEYRTWTIFCQTTDTYVVAGNTAPQTLLSSVLGSIFN